jgi:hypothetical protein
MEEAKPAASRTRFVIGAAIVFVVGAVLGAAWYFDDDRVMRRTLQAELERDPVAFRLRTAEMEKVAQRLDAGDRSTETRREAESMLVGSPTYRPPESLAADEHRQRQIAAREAEIEAFSPADLERFLSAIEAKISAREWSEAKRELDSRVTLVSKVATSERASEPTVKAALNRFASAEHAITAAAIRGEWEDERSAANQPPAGSSYTNYLRLREGMTRDQVVRILGSPGTEVSRSDLGGTSTVMYQWQNADGSNMNAMFQNGKLVSKAQFGLR